MAKSPDGLNWTIVDVTTLNNLASLSSVAYSAGTLIASSGNGYAYSLNGGASWTRATGDTPGPGSSSTSLIFVNSTYILSTTADGTNPNNDSFDRGRTYNNSLTPKNLIICRILLETILCGGRGATPSGFLLTSHDEARTFTNVTAIVTHLDIDVTGMTYSPILGMYAVAGFGVTNFAMSFSLSGPFFDANLIGSTRYAYTNDVAARLPPYLANKSGLECCCCGSSGSGRCGGECDRISDCDEALLWCPEAWVWDRLPLSRLET